MRAAFNFNEGLSLETNAGHSPIDQDALSSA